MYLFQITTNLDQDTQGVYTGYMLEWLLLIVTSTQHLILTSHS